MKHCGILILCLILIGCDYFEKRKVDADELLNASLESFNWSEVDTYPAFDNCDSIFDKADVRLCFESTLAQNIANQLSDKGPVVTKSLNDTVMLELHISELGVISLKTAAISQELSDHIPGIDSMLSSCVDALPKVRPAIKRGQEVKTEFKMPLIIKTD